MIEPLSSCINGFSHGYPLETERVVVLGDGPIGLLHLQLSKNLCRAKTAVVGTIPHRLKKASSMGADVIIKLDDDTNNNNNNKIYQACDHRYIDVRNDLNSGNGRSTAEILQFTAGKGTDIVIIATNNPAAILR